MDKQYEILFTPMHIGTAELKNRFIMCPMEGTSIIDWAFHCGFNTNAHDYYIDRAKDGVGLMIPGMTPLRSIIGDRWLWQNPQVFEPVKPLMEEIHAFGAKVFFQLGAGWGRSFVLSHDMAQMIGNPVKGPDGNVIMNMDALLVSADEGVPNVWMPQHHCRALTVDEIHEYVDAYAKTALLCKENGVDGIEVHAVHEGYLLDQFATKYTNHRSDEYGGSFENRYRFAVEVVKAIKAACGEDYPVSLRYSVLSKTKGFNQGAVPGEEYVEVGRDMEESEKAIAYLSEAGYDAFNSDNGTYDAWYWAHPPVYMPLNCNLEDVRHIKKFTDKPVFCAGKMQIDAAAEAISAGELDGVGLARQFLCDEHFLTKIREGRTEDIRPCIACHISCLPGATYKDKGVSVGVVTNINPPTPGGLQPGSCSLNPRTFNEKKYIVEPTKNPKKMAVIGGGIGGMEFAIQAARRGHAVKLYEKTGELGGLFRAAAAPDCKEKDKELIDWYVRQLKKYPIEVHLNTEIQSLDDLDADEVIVAAGGQPKRLPVPGGDNAVDVAEALLNEDKLGDSVAIIGGGLAGCELAYDLASKGKHPFLIEAQDYLIKDISINAANSTLIRDLLNYHKVPSYLESKVKAIEEHGVTVDINGEEKFLPADTVVSAVGFNPTRQFGGQTGSADAPHVHFIGDASVVTNLKGAVWMANDLILELN